MGNRNEIENMIPFLEKGFQGQQTQKIRRRGDESEWRNESLTVYGSE